MSVPTSNQRQNEEIEIKVDQDPMVNNFVVDDDEPDPWQSMNKPIVMPGGSSGGSSMIKLIPAILSE